MSRSRRDAFHPPSLAGEQGIALVTALFAALVVTLLGVSLTGLGMSALTTSRAEWDADDAMALADAGLGHALAMLQGSGGIQNFDGVLQTGDAVGCTGDELAFLPTLPVSGFPGAPERIPQAGVAFSAGTYRVSVCDDHTLELTLTPPNANPSVDANDTVLVRSIGTGANGAQAMAQVRLRLVDTPAILVDGNLRLNGTPSVMGAEGAVHANGALDLPGGPCTQQYFSSSNAITASGTPEGGAGCTAGAATLLANQEPIPVPRLNPNDYLPFVTYRLTNTGKILNAAGTVLFDITLPGPPQWNSWTWSASNQEWQGGNNIPAGTYYAEGNIRISGSPGSAATPLPATLVAVGYVTITGYPSLTPSLPGPPAYAVIAGTDLTINGNPSNPYQGVYYARDQFQITGNPSLNGQVIAAMAGDGPSPGGSNPVMLGADGFVNVGGTPLITYSGGSGLGAARKVSWRECRGADVLSLCGAP